MSLAHGGKLTDCVKIDQVHDADGTYDGTAQTMLDMKDYGGCAIIIVGAAVQSDATNFLKAVDVVSNSASDGSGTDHIVCSAVTTDGGTTETLAAADYGTAVNTTVSDKAIVLDFKNEELTPGDRYIAVNTTGSGTYPITVIYIRYNAPFQFKDMFQATRTAFQLDKAQSATT